MYRPGNKWQPTQVWGIAEVLERFQISKVNQVIDFLAMMGDASDNIPGIAGVGKKLLKNSYQNLDLLKVCLLIQINYREKFKRKLFLQKK